jgi:hypothetical protein
MYVSPTARPARTPTTCRYRTIYMKHADSPSQTIDDLHAHYQKILTESDSNKRLRNNTTTTTITTTLMRDDEQQLSIMTHVNLPCSDARNPPGRYLTIHMKRAESPSQTIDDLHAHYQKILTESDSKHLRNTTHTTTHEN